MFFKMESMKKEDFLLSLLQGFLLTLSLEGLYETARADYNVING
jgi:hypothetical protein